MSNTLSTAELAAMQVEAEHLLMTTTCAILRPTYAVNSSGEATASWATVTAAAACRLVKPGYQVQLGVSAGAVSVDVDWYLLLHHDQDVNNGDRAVVGGNTYTVIKANDEAGWLVFIRCALKRVEV